MLSHAPSRANEPAAHRSAGSAGGGAGRGRALPLVIYDQYAPRIRSLSGPAGCRRAMHHRLLAPEPAGGARPAPVMLDAYAVIGNPIGHSKSPEIHRRFADETAQNLTYVALLAPLGGFPDTVAEFVAAGGRGFNVTVPFKEEAWRLVADRSPRAAQARAVNTVVVSAGGGLFGDNTDGVGLIRDLVHNHAVAMRGTRVLLLGAGGAARGVVGPLLEQAPAVLVIANRTAARAVELAGAFADSGPVEGRGFHGLGDRQFDLIINATSAGLEGGLPPVPLGCLRPHGCCYDMTYGDGATRFQRWARAAGADLALDGLGMLVEQAAEAFLLWRGVRPSTSPVLAALRRSAKDM